MAKKAGFLGTDDLQTIDYNNDVTLDDLETVDFNDDTQMTDLTDIDKIDLKKSSATQQAAKIIIKKIQKFKKMGELSNTVNQIKKAKAEIMTLCLLNRFPHTRKID